MTEQPVFKAHIITHFRDDIIGSICQSDPGIVSFGKSLFQDEEQDRRVVMGPMRLMARILHQYRLLCQDDTTSTEDMMVGSHWPTIEKAVLAISNNQRSKLNMNISQTLRNFANLMLADAIINADMSFSEKRQQDLHNFMKVLEVKGKQLFKPAHDESVRRRKTVLQKPSQLPMESDIKRLNTEIDQILCNSLDTLTYRQLRRLILTR